MFEFAVFSWLIGSASFAILAMLLMTAHRGSFIGRILIFASVLNAGWLGAHAYFEYLSLTASRLTGLFAAELIRDSAWIIFLGALCSRIRDQAYARKTRLFLISVLLLCGAAIVVLLTPYSWAELSISFRAMQKGLLMTFLAVSIAGLILVEQLYRNTDVDSRWMIKHLCFGIGAIFVYDFYLFADAVLFNRINRDIWSARGAINAVTMPLIAIAAARNRDWQLNLFVSRKIIFHTTAVFGAGIYLIVMAAAGYYLRTFGGSWGGAFRIVFFFAGFLSLVAVIFSTQLRSRLRVFLARHFYKNKYEYGDVWLTFTQQLAESDTDPTRLRQTILMAVAKNLDCTGGLLWQKDRGGNYSIAATWNANLHDPFDISGEHELVRTLEVDKAVIDLTDVASRFGTGQLVEIPRQLLQMPQAWLVVPIVHREELLAFLVLFKTHTGLPLVWEDRDLLHTLGRQAASYLAVLRATEALSEVRQFEAFNRLSAFLVHDLKNVVAQLDLIVKNSERHGDNPEFITDAFNTISDASAKISHMLTSLQQTQRDAENVESFELQPLIAKAVSNQGADKPHPHFICELQPVFVTGNPDQFLSIIEHLIRNAQDATAESGRITITLVVLESQAIIEITDTGSGMTREFIDERLFKPFDTTKGKAGMGIGVYESQHVVLSMEGRLTVKSEVGQGTTFRISLPRTSDAESNEADVTAEGSE